MAAGCDWLPILSIKFRGLQETLKRRQYSHDYNSQMEFTKRWCVCKLGMKIPVIGNLTNYIVCAFFPRNMIVKQKRMLVRSARCFPSSTRWGVFWCSVSRPDGWCCGSHDPCYHFPRPEVWMEPNKHARGLHQYSKCSLLHRNTSPTGGLPIQPPRLLR